ncbi:MAG: hypothetical protein H7Y86_14045 [Rhizobacter sp.]|nr:hypothetical protein [Ferruginibacter sp.]
MKRNHFFPLLIAMLLSSIITTAQSAKTYPDLLTVPGPVSFEGMSYKLAWSSHPTATYYKQEYLPAGDALAKFTSMLMLELVIADMTIKDIVAAKVDELKAMKASNPIVNYEMFQKDGEYILDFLLSANEADGKSIAVIERNVYRYKTFTDKSGKKGVLLFSVSTRAYGKAADAFLVNLKATKSKIVNAVAKFMIPAVVIKK